MIQLQQRFPSRPDDTLRKAPRLVDEETGVIRLLYEAPLAPDGPRIFGCGSLCSDYGGLGNPSENSVSGSTSLVRDQAIAGAIGEAIERYSAAFVPHERIVLRTSASVGKGGIAPWSLTLYDEAQYGHPGFGYKPVRPEDPIGWVEGWSLTRDASVLVPAFAVYQPYLGSQSESPVIQQVTTGLACGNTLEEAILSAICEVVERDAAMLMWLQSRRAPKVTIDAVSAPMASAALDRFAGLAQHVTLLDVTTDLRIPSYVAVWDGPIAGQHGAIFASCAHLNPDRAAVGALTELAQCLMWAGSLLDKNERLPNPKNESLSSIEQHVLWPLHPVARGTFEFALSSKQRVGLDVHDKVVNAEVSQAIRTCVRLIADQGMEVVIVDVTSPDIQECGFHVVKAVLPGAQPLFFGTGMHRLSERASRNTYPDRAAETLNLHPHPYP